MKLPLFKTNWNVAMHQAVYVDSLWRQSSWFDPRSAHVQLVESQGDNGTGVSPTTSVLPQCSILTYLSPTLLQFRKWLQGFVTKKKQFLFLSFRRVLNVICSFLGNSPAPEFQMTTFRNSLSVPKRRQLELRPEELPKKEQITKRSNVIIGRWAKMT